MQQGTANEFSQLGQQLRKLCEVLPSCRALDPAIQSAREEALADLYVTLQDVSGLFYQARSRATPGQPQPSSASVKALADYLFAHPDRCDETLRPLEGVEVDWATATVKGSTPRPIGQTVSSSVGNPTWPASTPTPASNDRLSRAGETS